MQPSASIEGSSNLVIRRAMVRINRAGAGLPNQASWPFTKLIVQAELLTVKLYRTNLTFTPDNLVGLEEYSQAYGFGQPVGEHGVRILPKSPISTPNMQDPVVSVEVSLRTKDFKRVVARLQACGFTVHNDS